eukprot:CAMPEP_0174712962 /NCGR_PEP_ID=MMETSP1094-20130205/13782_1 /TAXON_ID=156173 /ORGANISM="Chrysochromulina brevifilum, Strain UTEX LB 985" /LENGTH=463 /DNA_ID=CAMNT_0015912087 /DNA_START=27 /DNA_END=1418 /DNA_ORIENTATION=+
MLLAARWAADEPEPSWRAGGVRDYHPQVARLQLHRAWWRWSPRSLAWRENRIHCRQAHRAWTARALKTFYRRWHSEWARQILQIHEARHMGLDAAKRQGLRAWCAIGTRRAELARRAAHVGVAMMKTRWCLYLHQKRLVLTLVMRLQRFFAGWRVFTALREAARRAEHGVLLSCIADARRWQHYLERIKEGWGKWRAFVADVKLRADASAAISASFVFRNLFAKLAVRRGWRRWRATVHGRMQHVKLRETSRRFERTQQRVHMAGSLGAWHSIRSMCETELVFLRTKATTVCRTARLGHSWRTWDSYRVLYQLAMARRRDPIRTPLSAARQDQMRQLTSGRMRPSGAHGLRDASLFGVTKWRHKSRVLLRMASMLANQEKVLEKVHTLVLAAGGEGGGHSETLLATIEEYFETTGGCTASTPPARAKRDDDAVWGQAFSTPKASSPLSASASSPGLRGYLHWT